MDRLQVINYLIDKNQYRYYLEIGTFTGYTLKGCIAEDKLGVDPDPRVREDMAKDPYWTTYKEKDYTIVKATSDDFFRVATGVNIDLAFIDGMHKSEFVARDIQNCLKWLSPGGMILLHDMLPPSLEHVTTGDKHGNWNGDCYKALLEFIKNDPLGFYSVFTIDTDWGIGIIKPHKGDFQPFERNYSVDYYRALHDWDYFDKNRDELLNVISVEEFKKLY